MKHRLSLDLVGFLSLSAPKRMHGPTRAILLGRSNTSLAQVRGLAGETGRAGVVAAARARALRRPRPHGAAARDPQRRGALVRATRAGKSRNFLYSKP